MERHRNQLCLTFQSIEQAVVFSSGPTRSEHCIYSIVHSLMTEGGYTIFWMPD